MPAAADALQSGGAVWRGIAVWDKLNARPMPDRFKAQAECIVWGTNGPKRMDAKDKGAACLPGVFQCASPPPSARSHSTEKPVALLRRLAQVARPSQTILDPFMGSGSTGVARAETGRKFVGIELSERYFEIACKRIREAHSQCDLFEEAGNGAAKSPLLF